MYFSSVSCCMYILAWKSTCVVGMDKKSACMCHMGV